MTSQQSVILISDDEQLARMASWLLAEEGYSVTHCRSVSESLRNARLIESPVVVFDGPMGRTKRDAARRLREAFRDARIVGLHVHSEGIEAHIDAEGHLHKPFHADDLLDVVADVLARPPGTASQHAHAR
jgi:FixJ family two-component response regulator